MSQVAFHSIFSAPNRKDLKQNTKNKILDVERQV